MSIRRLPPSLAIVLVLALAAPPVTAEVLRVPGDHPTIQAAIDAAGPGDEVLVTHGSHAERVLLQGRSGLTLRMTGKARLDGQFALEAGVTVAGCSDIELVGLHVRRSAGGALLVKNSADVQVEGGRLQQIGADAIAVVGSQDVSLVGLRLLAIGRHGITAAGGTGLLVEDVVLRDLGGSGLLLGHPGAPEHDVVVRENRVDRAVGDGLALLAGGGLVVENRVRRVDGHGIAASPLAGSTGLLLEDNLVARVGGVGLAIAGREHVLRRNDVLKPGLVGVVLAGAAHVLEDGRVVRAGVDGVLVLGLAPGEGGDAGQHELRGNLVRRPQRDGVVLGPNAAGNRVEENLVVRAAADGYQVESTSNDLTDNVSRGAGLNGFEMHEGGNIVRFNEATGSAAFDLQDLAGEAGNLYVDNVFPKLSIF